MPKTTKQPVAQKRQQTDMPANNSMLQELFHEELKDIYWAEKHLVKSLPKMAKAASSDELRNAFEEHLEATQVQVERLEQVFEMLNKKAQAKKCEAMEGLVEEAEQLIDDTEDNTSTRDVALILAAQKIEHYEIATYGGLIVLAKTLDMPEVASILKESIAEEKEADETLTGIAENSANCEAAEERADEE